MQPFLSKRNFDFKKIGALAKPFPVLAPSERFAIKDTDRFKQAITEQEGAVKNRHDRFFFGNNSAIQEYDHPLLLSYRDLFRKWKLIESDPRYP